MDKAKAAALEVGGDENVIRRAEGYWVGFILMGCWMDFLFESGEMSIEMMGR